MNASTSVPTLRLTQRELDALPEYSTSFPTGTTLGKKWKCNLLAALGLRLRPHWIIGEYYERDDINTKIRWFDVDIVDQPTLVAHLSAEVERLNDLADENDGHAKRHAAEADELKQELRQLRDADMVVALLDAERRETARLEESIAEKRKLIDRLIDERSKAVCRAEKAEAELDALQWNAAINPGAPRR